jgi:hypothetical protein
MSETITKTFHSTRELGPEGHVSYAWDADDDEWMLPLIRQKMADGYVFWIVKRNPLREEQLRNVEDVADSRHVIIRDEAARQLFEDGHIALVAEGEDFNDLPEQHFGRARTPEEAVAADTVSHRPLRGG